MKTNETKKYWISELPEGCEICNKPFGKYFIDGQYMRGPWALMCEKCHETHGSGLGGGKGQKYLTATRELVEGGCI